MKTCLKISISLALVYLLLSAPVYAKQLVFGKHGKYKEVKTAYVLETKGALPAIKRGVLVVDTNGRPAIYFTYYEGEYCAAPSSHTLEEVVLHWGGARETKDGYVFDFICRNSEERTAAQVELKFEDGACSRFRILSKAVKKAEWQSTKDLPVNVALAVPRRFSFLGDTAPGPSTLNICGVHTVPKRYEEAVAAGKCALELTSNEPSTEK